jgi:hypothetical protein
VNGRAVAAVGLPAALAALGAFAERAEGALLVAGAAAVVGTLATAGPRRPRGDLAACVLLAALLAALLEVVHGGVPAPWAAVAVVTGAQLAAAALRRSAPRAARAVAPWCALVIVLGSGAYDLFGSAPAAFARIEPALGARVLDAAPATLLTESAGLDWMRHPNVYASAGTDWFSDRRAPFDGTLAALVALVVGCASFGVATLRRVGPAQER